MNSLQGDFGTLIEDSRAGVVTQGASQEEINKYAKEIVELLDDFETPMRCRALAEKELSLDLGVKELIFLYKRLQLA